MSELGPGKNNPEVGLVLLQESESCQLDKTKQTLAEANSSCMCDALELQIEGNDGTEVSIQLKLEQEKWRGGVTRDLDTAELIVRSWKRIGTGKALTFELSRSNVSIPEQFLPDAEVTYSRIIDEGSLAVDEKEWAMKIFDALYPSERNQFVADIRNLLATVPPKFADKHVRSCYREWIVDYNDGTSITWQNETPMQPVSFMNEIGYQGEAGRDSVISFGSGGLDYRVDVDSVIIENFEKRLRQPGTVIDTLPDWERVPTDRVHPELSTMLAQIEFAKRSGMVE